MPRVSVVIPLYNKEREVEKAIRSALAQTMGDFELIVVNDGSTDKGPELVRGIQDVRITHIEQPNAGVSAARNRGIDAARAEVITFLDADDEWLPDYLTTIMGLRSDYPSCDLFGTRYFLSSPTGQKDLAIIRDIPHEGWEGILSQYFVTASKSDPPLWTSAVGVTKKAIETVGGFPVGVSSGEDLLTWARLAARYQIAYSTKPCAIFYNPRKQSDRPGRMPQQPDFVGESLKGLLDNAGPAAIPGLKAYIALWHRMRAVIYVRLGDRSNALKELRKAMHFVPGTKLFLLFVIASLPGPFPVWVLASLKRIRVSS